MRLVDSHAHLQVEAFAPDVGFVLEAARSAGVERILVPGWDIASSEAGVALSVGYGVPTSAGIHPHVASTADEGAWAALKALASRPEVAAVGETGLDYDRAFSPRPAQLENLRRHLAIALECAKPLILHCRSRRGERDAQDELIAELRAAGVGEGSWRAAFGARPPAVLHSFSGPVDYAEAALGMGLAVSFSGLVFRRGEEASAAAAALVPADRLLVETDAPYLSPPGAPRRNEPVFVATTARWLAERRGVAEAELGPALVGAFDRLFGA